MLADSMVDSTMNSLTIRIPNLNKSNIANSLRYVKGLESTIDDGMLMNSA